MPWLWAMMPVSPSTMTQIDPAKVRKMMMAETQATDQDGTGRRSATQRVTPSIITIRKMAMARGVTMSLSQ